jgi:hypothetical protein
MESQRRIELMAHADPATKEQVTALLDELTRPLTVRELDAQLAPYYTRKKRREIIKALYFLQPIVLLAPKRPMAEKPDWGSVGDGPPASACGGTGCGEGAGAA